MRPTLDLSIAQRMAIGVGLYLLIAIGLMASVFVRHEESARAQTAYIERIVPLRDRMETYERSMVRTVMAVRTAVLEPTKQQIALYRSQADTTRHLLDQLAREPLEPSDRELMDRIVTASQAYLRTADEAVARAASGSFVAGDDLALTRRGLALAGYLEQFSAHKATQAQAAVYAMATARDRLRDSLLLAFALTTAVLLAFAWLTTRSITRPTRRLLRTADALERGDWQPALALAREPDAPQDQPPRDEMRQIANAFGSAALALESREQRLRAESRVAKSVSSTLERGGTAGPALRAIVEHIGASIGVIYWTPDAARPLEPVAAYGVADLGPVAPGEGVPGQAARDRRPVVLGSLPRDSGFAVKLGYDQAPPKTVAAFPLLFQENLHGVLLIASLRTLAAEQLAFLEAAAGQLGIGFHNIAAYERIQMLLADLRARNEQIQAQNEELQAQNEEIQAQNEEIQAQSQQLQVQHEEIQAQNEQLREHATMLAEADDRKNKFLGVLAHELRNPMAPISNSIFILKRARPGSADALRAQEIIERQTRHLVRLIDDLLDVTRISEGKIRIQRERLDLAEVIRACVEDLEASFEQNELTLTLDLPEGDIPIEGDRTRLSQVLGNLLNNSIKFCDRGGHVKVSVTVTEGQAVLRVADNGVGMEPMLLPRLFQPFSQGEVDPARPNGGLGLGLALVKSLVQLHGGTVTAHSEGPGRGAEFTVYLPLAERGVLA